MEIVVEVTEAKGVKLTAYQGPLLASIIFDVGDEDPVMKMLAQGFADANDLPHDDHPHDPPPIGRNDPPPIVRKRKAKV